MMETGWNGMEMIKEILGSMKRNKILRCVVGLVALVLAMGMGQAPVSAQSQTSPAVIQSTTLTEGRIKVSGVVESGYDYAVVEKRSAVDATDSENWVAGALGGAGGPIELSIPTPEGSAFFILKLLRGGNPPTAEFSGDEYFRFLGNPSVGMMLAEYRPAHVLNRLAYGPTESELGQIVEIGIAEYIHQQLNPGEIPESAYVALRPAEDALFSEYQPSRETILIPRFTEWAYRKGTSAPPSTWKSLDFDDSDWPVGRSGFGYGDEDDNTVFRDMRRTDANPEGYVTFAIRRKFAVLDPLTTGSLVLRVNFDDAFVAYLNGVEVARANVSGANPTFDQIADGNHEAGEFEDFDISQHRSLLKRGVNVVAIQLHNYLVTSSDASLIPELLLRENLDIPPINRISGIDALQQLIHVRGVYAPNQLQTVLGEFWENHFTTDFDKVADYFSELENSNGAQAMSMSQARSEAAQAEFQEYNFFHQNALGRFEDLLLYSATSVPQLIYLDNVTNTRNGPNENYAREILELFAFGVDNRYTQNDIEQLARCFTGWTVRKVWPQELKQYPQSAVAPFTGTNVRYIETPLIDLGAIWRYAKGTLEPTPDSSGNPTTQWATPEFNDGKWLQGATGIGYGDDDDRTVLNDMRRNYSSVYLRKSFTLDSPDDLKDLVFSVDYDDGYVAYLNGVEIARSATLTMAGTPPAFDDFASRNRESNGRFESVPMARFADTFRFGGQQNILAIQVHNVTLNSSDLSIHPKLVYRTLEEGSIENGDPNGAWAFRFNINEHDISRKVIFEGTDWEMVIPANRTGLAGLLDAQEVIRMMVNHISTREFICIKLINRFVSDDITLESYHAGTAPENLINLLHQCMDKWLETKGSIRDVMEVILDPARQSSPFWANDYYRAKVKTPVEFINSSLRALNGQLSGTAIPDINDKMGMHLFTRDDPDGWSEYGFDWISTSALLERINFVQDLTANSRRTYTWNHTDMLTNKNLRTAEDIVRYFDEYLFQGTLGEQNIQLLVQHAETDDSGSPRPLVPTARDYASRVRDLIGLILSAPHWQFQ